MIQRVQSIWLLLAGLTVLLLLVLPIVSTQSNGTEFWIQATGLFQKVNGVTTKTQYFSPLFITTIAVSLLCLATIFAFKNRAGQKRLIFAAIAALLLLGFWIFTYAKELPGGISAVTYGIGTFLPIAALAFCVLALRGIRNDEQLLRSADRLR